MMGDYNMRYVLNSLGMSILEEALWYAGAGPALTGIYRWE